MLSDARLIALNCPLCSGARLSPSLSAVTDSKLEIQELPYDAGQRLRVACMFYISNVMEILSRFSVHQFRFYSAMKSPLVGK